MEAVLMRILINNIHSTNSTSIIVLLKRITNIPIKIYGSDTAPRGYIAASNLVDAYFQSPPIDEGTEFTAFLKFVCATEHIDLVIPSSDKEVRYWAYYLPDIPVKVYVPAPHIVRLFSDKKDAARAVQNIGISVPKEIDNFFDDNLGKVIFRKRTAVSSQGIEIVDFNTEKYIPNHFNQGWFAQEYISGDEYAVDVFCDKHGVPKLIIPKKRIEMRSGATIRSQLIKHERIIAICKKLYSAFCVPGLSDVEFIESDRGLHFIEMNMRFSASAICGIIGSFNYLEQYLQHFCGDATLEELDYYMQYVCWNSIVTRYYKDTIFYPSSGRS